MKWMGKFMRHFENTETHCIERTVNILIVIWIGTFCPTHVQQLHPKCYKKLMRFVTIDLNCTIEPTSLAKPRSEVFLVHMRT
jgi:hypothetical protein